MAYPEVTYKAVIVGRSIESIIQQTKGGELEIPNHEFMQADALEIYLDGCKIKLCSLSCYNVEDTTKKILQIFNFLNKPTLCGSEEQHRGLIRRIWPCKNLNTVSLYPTFLVDGDSYDKSVVRPLLRPQRS